MYMKEIEKLKVRKEKEELELAQAIANSLKEDEN